MKKILLITTACLTLNACETVDTISWPTMPSLDLFSDTQPVENISTQNTPAPTLNRATIDTELSEMEKLTGYAPRFDNTASKSKIVDVADAPVKEVIEEAIKPAEKATVTQPIEITKAITTEPIIKPNGSQTTEATNHCKRHQRRHSIHYYKDGKRNRQNSR